MIVNFPNGDWAEPGIGSKWLSPIVLCDCIAKCHCGFLDSGEDLPGHCRECIEPLSDEAAQLLHVIARIDHAIDPLDGTRPHGVVLERHIVFHCSTMPNAWFRPIAKQAPLSGYYNWHNEGWIHWSTASSAFRTDEELTQYGIDHGTETFPEFPLPMRDQTIAWKVPLKIGTLLERAQQLSNPGNANGRWAIVVLPRGIACKMTGVLAACQLKDYEVIGLTYDRDRIDEAPQGSQIAIDSRRESAIVIPPGMSVRISQMAAPPLAVGSTESDARNWSHWDDQDSMRIDA